MLSLIIDTDTGSDDAVALLMAARRGGVSIKAVTCVAGNVSVDQATRNARATLELAGCDEVPVYRGLHAPLIRAPETAQHVHGEDGMSGFPLPEPRMLVQTEGAIEALVRLSRAQPGRHTLVTLGPLSNIATAILVEPRFLLSFNQVVAMAGAFDAVGNVHRVGEFNAWADPEAIKIVVEAEGSVTFVGWDLSRPLCRDHPRTAAQAARCGQVRRVCRRYQRLCR